MSAWDGVERRRTSPKGKTVRELVGELDADYDFGGRVIREIATKIGRAYDAAADRTAELARLYEPIVGRVEELLSSWYVDQGQVELSVFIHEIGMLVDRLRKVTEGKA